MMPKAQTRDQRALAEIEADFEILCRQLYPDTKSKRPTVEQQLVVTQLCVAKRLTVMTGLLSDLVELLSEKQIS